MYTMNISSSAHRKHFKIYVDRNYTLKIKFKDSKLSDYLPMNLTYRDF